MSEILGVLFAVLVGILILPKFAHYQQISNDNARATTTAQQQKQLAAAATTYIQQNTVAVQAAATSTAPAVITVAMLQGVGILPASFAATNPYGQTWQVEVLQPTAGNLQTLVMSTGGTALADKQAVKIAAIVGAAGGFIPQNDSGTYPGGSANAYGSFAGWTVPTTNYTSVTGGHLAALLTFNNGQLVSPYLYRNAVPGQPWLNRMATAIDMQANNLNNAGQVNTATLAATSNATVGGTLGVTGVATAAKVQLNDVVVAGAACASNGLIAQDSAGFILSCQSGVWAKQASSGGGAGGLKGVFLPLAGQSIQYSAWFETTGGKCTYIWRVRVGADGQPYVGYFLVDSGWVDFNESPGVAFTTPYYNLCSKGGSFVAMSSPPPLGEMVATTSGMFVKYLAQGASTYGYAAIFN